MGVCEGGVPELLDAGWITGDCPLDEAIALAARGAVLAGTGAVAGGAEDYPVIGVEPHVDSRVRDGVRLVEADFSNSQMIFAGPVTVSAGVAAHTAARTYFQLVRGRPGAFGHGEISARSGVRIEYAEELYGSGEAGGESDRDVESGGILRFGVSVPGQDQGAGIIVDAHTELRVGELVVCTVGAGAVRNAQRVCVGDRVGL